MSDYPEEIGSPLTPFVSPVTGADGGYLPEAPQSGRRHRRERERVRMPVLGLHPDPFSTYLTRDESVAAFVSEENTACSDETELLSLQEENRFMVTAMKDKSSLITRYSKKMTKEQICIQDRRQKMSELTGESSRNCRLLQETSQELGSVIAEMEGHGGYAEGRDRGALQGGPAIVQINMLRKLQEDVSSPGTNSNFVSSPHGGDLLAEAKEGSNEGSFNYCYFY